jgi:hypothetical protein
VGATRFQFESRPFCLAWFIRKTVCYADQAHRASNELGQSIPTQRIMANHQSQRCVIPTEPEELSLQEYLHLIGPRTDPNCRRSQVQNRRSTTKRGDFSNLVWPPSPKRTKRGTELMVRITRVRWREQMCSQMGTIGTAHRNNTVRLIYYGRHGIMMIVSQFGPHNLGSLVERPST